MIVKGPVTRKSVLTLCSSFCFFLFFFLTFFSHFMEVTGVERYGIAIVNTGSHCLACNRLFQNYNIIGKKRNSEGEGGY